MDFVPATDRYSATIYWQSGSSALRLPAISLGLWQNFGSDRRLETTRPIVHRTFDLGTSHFDLAKNYGRPYSRPWRTSGGYR
jgi:L-glyceraldehyde 3-phosphate reductase